MQYGENSAEQNKLHNTYGMTHCLGEIQNRTQRRRKSTENCNHNNYERKMMLKKRNLVYCNRINLRQHNNQIPQEARQEKAKCQQQKKNGQPGSIILFK